MSAKTVYLISGGPSLDRGKLETCVRTALEACGKPSPRVAYIGTASLDSRSFFGFFRRPMLNAGAGSVEMVRIAAEDADAETAARQLSEADAIFVSGGEVEDGMVWLKKFGLDTVLRGEYEKGKLFFGISAGCIMMGQHWVHWDVEGDDSTASLFDCLGFLPHTFDAHGENEGWKELKCALRLLGDGADGVGLTDGGFFCADGRGNLRNIFGAPKELSNDKGVIIEKNQEKRP